MDDLLGALGESIAHAGPQYATLIVVTVLFLWQVWPTIDAIVKQAVAREDRREQRKAEESARREEHDREQLRLNGQWLEQQDRSNSAMERSNAVTEGVRAQLERLNDSLDTSKGHSARMGEAVERIGTKTDAIYERLVGAGKE